MNHRVDLSPTHRGDRADMVVNGRAIGNSRVPLCDAARVLLGEGVASPDDTITTFRGDTPCLFGRVGAAAGQTVSEPPRGGLRFSRWQAFDASVVGG